MQFQVKHIKNIYIYSFFKIKNYISVLDLQLLNSFLCVCQWFFLVLSILVDFSKDGKNYLYPSTPLYLCTFYFKF